MKFPNILRIGIVTNMDIFRVNTSEKGDVQITGGLEANFVKLLSESLNFTYNARIPDDNEWGRYADGKWTGVIGLVSTNETDIGISKIGINYEKTSAVDFSYPYSIEGVTFATRPPGLLTKETAVILPFSWGLWTALFVTMILVTFALKLLLRRSYTLPDICLYVFGSIFLNAKDIKSKHTGERFMVTAWLFSSMLLAYSYNAVLLSFLTVPLKEEPIGNKFRLLEVMNRVNYKCVTPSGSFVLKTLLTSNDMTTASIATLIEKNNWLINPTKESLVDILNQKKVAAINPRNHFRIILPSKILVAKDSFFSLYWGIAVNKNFCCKNTLDRMIQRIIASGLYLKYENDYYFQTQLKYSKLNNPENEEEEALKLRDVISAFLFLLSGYILSIISLSVEIICNNKHSKKFI